MSVAIREATPADIPVIANLILGLAKFERLEHQVTMTEERLHEGIFGERRYCEVLIAEDSGEAAGFALFFHNFSTFLGLPGLYLEDLFVMPEHRRKGIGRALLARLAGIAVERRCGRLEWAVLDWNDSAIAFYEQLGARPNSEWTTYRIAGQALARLAGK
jgi:GNAT superfamily N-acetyltransferase